MLCKICQCATQPLAKAKLLTKHDIQYFQCPNCGFVQTEEPYWLDEAYSEAITRSDLGLASRNISLANVTRAVITFLFDGAAKFVDYGGGYGLLVRLMRDHGFEFYRFDKFCANLFAQGFDVNFDGDNHYELLTAFEVFEHLENPLDEIAEMGKFSRNILFSTELIPPSNPGPQVWWYYGLEHGQHISFYTRKSLEIIAQRFGLTLYRGSSSLYLLTEKEIMPWLFRWVSHRRAAQMANTIFKRKSLLMDDYHKLTGKRLN